MMVARGKSQIFGHATTNQFSRELESARLAKLEARSSLLAGRSVDVPASVEIPLILSLHDDTGNIQLQVRAESFAFVWYPSNAIRPLKGA